MYHGEDKNVHLGENLHLRRWQKKVGESEFIKHQTFYEKRLDTIFDFWCIKLRNTFTAVIVNYTLSSTQITIINSRTYNSIRRIVPVGGVKTWQTRQDQPRLWRILLVLRLLLIFTLTPVRSTEYVH